MRRWALLIPAVLLISVLLAAPAAADNCDIFINAEDCQNTGWTVGVVATLAGGVAVATAATLASRPQEKHKEEPRVERRPTSPPPHPPPDRNDVAAPIELRAGFGTPTTKVQPPDGVVSADSMKLVAHSDPGGRTVREALRATPDVNQFARRTVNQIELAPGMTVRQAAFAHRGSDEALVREMTTNSPDDIASRHLEGRRAKTHPANRMLNSRIVEFGLQFLDQELSKPLLSGLAKYRALLEASRDSLADPRQAEVVVTLIEPHEITSTHSPYVVLEANGAEIGRIPFELTMVFGMFQTAVAVKRGAIESVICETCSLDVTLSLPEWQPPLLQRKVQLPVRLPVRPPLRIPGPEPT